jgi:hypothetical protein
MKGKSGMLIIGKGTIPFRYRQIPKFWFVLLSVFALFLPIFAGSFNGKNPSLHQIDSLWRAMYGAPVHQAIVVFNKMAGGTDADISLDTLCIMRLTSASNTATLKSLFYCKQWTGNSVWGVASGHRISPDGTKIAILNNTAVMVCDTNGSNVKVINTVNVNIDQLSSSWDDSAHVRRLVYSTGPAIVRTIINENNTPGKTDTLWNHAWGLDPPAGNNGRYTSANKVGNFISFDIVTWIMLPIVVDLRTKTVKNPTNGGDGCHVRLLYDGLGTVTYHESTHLTGTTIWRWPSTKIGSISCPNGQTDKCTDCGNCAYYWCDTDTNFMIQTGDNEQSVSPGCYSKAFIRKGKAASASIFYIGDYFGFPALWVDPEPLVSTCTLKNSHPAGGNLRATVTITSHTLRMSGSNIDNVILHNINGTVMAKIGSGSSCVNCSLPKLCTGTYLLAWRQGNRKYSQYLTISK